MNTLLEINEVTECYETLKKITVLNEWICNPDNFGENYNKYEERERREMIIYLTTYLNILINRCKRLNLDVEDIITKYKGLQLPYTFYGGLDYPCYV